MRNIYIAVGIFFIACIALFIASFIYVDKAGHKIYYFTINIDGHDFGSIKIDKYETEDKIIYRQSAAMPFGQLFTSSRSRIDFDRKYNLESYLKESFANRAVEYIYLEKRKDLASFVGAYDSKFACLIDFPVKKETFIFEEDSPATYLPIIENYNFKKGRSQGFNALTFFSPFLPPVKRFVMLTSVRDEYLKIDSKRIKTELLLLKIRNYPQGAVWVSKADRSVIKIEIPQRNIRIIRNFSPWTLKMGEYARSPDGYISKEARFKSRGAELVGTLTVPQGDGPFPSVLLVWGEGPQDRDYQGLFASMADYLSKNGFGVFRFDKRGIGSSGGDPDAVTDNSEADDVKSALEYMAGQKELDSKKMYVIGYSKGAYPATVAAARGDPVRGLILMDPLPYVPDRPEQRIAEAKSFVMMKKGGEDYLKTADKCVEETYKKVRGSRGDWTHVLGKKCFLKNMREGLQKDLLDVISRVKTPVLIFQRKGSGDVSSESAFVLDRVLEKSGNTNNKLVYYGDLGQFFGKRVNDGIHRIHYDTDRDVLENINSWLSKDIQTAN